MQADTKYEIWVDGAKLWLLKDSDKENDWGLFESEDELTATTGFFPQDCIGAFNLNEIMELSRKMPFFNWFALDYKIANKEKVGE